MFLVAIVRTFANGAGAIVTVPWGLWMAYKRKRPQTRKRKRKERCTAGTSVHRTALFLQRGDGKSDERRVGPLRGRLESGGEIARARTMVCVSNR